MVFRSILLLGRYVTRGFALHPRPSLSFRKEHVVVHIPLEADLETVKVGGWVLSERQLHSPVVVTKCPGADMVCRAWVHMRVWCEMAHRSWRSQAGG